MPGIEYVLVAVYVVYVVYAVLRRLPTIVFLLNPSTVRCRFVEPPEGLESAIKSDGLRELVSKIESLGFRLLGIKSERLPLWSRPVEEISLESCEACAFASVLNNPGKPCFYFYTPFISGAVVLTANAAFPEVQKVDFVQSTMSAGDPANVLSIHQRNVQQLRDRGEEPFVLYTQESRLQATWQYYASDSVHSQLRLKGTAMLMVLLAQVLLSGVLIWMLWQG